MSNKPNLKRKPESDVLVNYCIMKAADAPADIEAALKVVAKHVMTHPIYYHIDPVMHDGQVLFSLIGFPSDHSWFQRMVPVDVAGYNCVLRNSGCLPVPKKK